MTNARVRVSWNIPAPVVLAILAQVAVTGWVGARQISTIEGTIQLVEARVTALEANAASNSQLAERVKGVEVRIDVLNERGMSIEGKLDKLIERGMR